MLFHLKRAGKFRGVKAVAFGEMVGCAKSSPAEELRGVIEDTLAGLDIPLVFGLRFGHTTGGCLTLPLGVEARLEVRETVRLKLLEPAVSAAPKAGNRAASNAKEIAPMIALKPGANIHLVGIAGTAMSALAGLLQGEGYRVTGSDAGIYPPISTLLDELGIAVVEGYSASNIDTRPDLVVIGNALSRGNEEVEAVLDSKLSYASMPEALRELFLLNRETIVVAGTHGKTTTTSILAWIFQIRRPRTRVPDRRRAVKLSPQLCAGYWAALYSGRR